MVKKAISFMSAFVLLLTLLAGVMLPAGASEYDDINDDAVFLKQQSSVTCTLVSNVMMFRRRAILDGNSNWSSITEASVKPTAWTNGGMRWDVTYSGMRTVTYGMNGDLHYSQGDLAGKRQFFIDQLQTHPEGIVIYCHPSSSSQHAVLLTDYDSYTDTFYCADPSSKADAGRIPLGSCSLLKIVTSNYSDAQYIDANQDKILAYVQQIWRIDENSNFNGGSDTYSPSYQVPTLSISEQNAPYSRRLGANFGIRGIVTTSCGQITELYGAIYDNNGNVVQCAYYYPNDVSVNLRYTINNDLIFDRLSAGSYTYYVEATAQNGSQQTTLTLICSDFTVS